MKKENMIFRLKLEIGDLVNEMVAKLPDELFSSDSTTFLDPSMGGGQYVSAIENRLRTHGHIDENIKNRVFGVEKSLLRVNYAIKKNKLSGTYSVDKNDVPSILIANMKFDCIVGNPPYQKAVGERKTEPLWHIFVENSIKSLKDGGYLCFVHPSGWRNFEGKFKDVGILIKNKDVQYLEIHSIEDGLRTFNAQIRYDWYVLKNSLTTGKTEIKFQDGEVKVIDLNSLPFVPNASYDKVKNIIDNTNSSQVYKEKTSVIYDRTEYGTDKKNVSRENSAQFKYPVVYSINCKGVPTFFYSSIKGNHFGIPKFIIPNGDARSIGFIEDVDGKYGLTQFACAIVESDPKILGEYHKCFLNKEFIKFYNTSICIGKTQYNHRILSLFRKDFYKDFI